MMTPSHVLVNLALLGRFARAGGGCCRNSWPAAGNSHDAEQCSTRPLPAALPVARSSAAMIWLAIIIGAMLPDVPRLLSRTVEWAEAAAISGNGSPTSGASLKLDRAISAAGSHVPWQTLVDVLHSVPLALILLFFAVALKRRELLIGVVSGLLHDIEDFFTHDSDPHPHFWPLSSWKFHCPLPPWGFGATHYHFGILEIGLILIVSLPLFRLLPRGWPRWLLILADLVYVALGVRTILSLIWGPGF